ncbi:MAG TPA: archaeosortase/exosortase family protein, partial [candidate division Zixibacteria bacterium]|nr:archaeosortase/exosortase family protein [candidate division Zixibacteria bacterium]
MTTLAIGKARWALLFTFLALWPAWIRQIKFGMHSFPAGLVMFVVLVGWWAFEQRQTTSKEDGTGVSAYVAWGLLILYAVLLGRIPPLGTQILATITLACALLAAIPQRIVAGRVAYLVLFPLSLPLETALQFVLGYPFRRMSALAAGALLSPYGVAVKGTTLMYTTHPLEVDAACSGVLGLWAFLIVG